MSNTSRFTRRRLLTDATRLASLAAATTLMPPNVQRLMAQAPNRAGSLKDIKHIVLLMQENRSFDHYFGTLSGVRGFGDRDPLILPGGRNVFHQPDAQNPNGYLLPFHLDSFSTNAQKLPSTSHEWDVQHQAWNGGAMDQWLPAHRAADGAHGPYTMGYFRRQDIPFHYALAEAFTICDAYHSSVMGPTWPNRLYYLTGMIDPEATGGGPVTRNKMPGDGFRWKSYPERLEDAGIDWRIYQYGEAGKRHHNMFKYFERFRNAPAGSSLAQRGMPDTDEDRFAQDVLGDRLPAVSWIYPSAEANEHPKNMPAAGADFIARRLNELAANPDVWAKTAFILNYDENDGLFDHVPPPVPPAGTPGEFVDGVPIGAGFRVPCIIISPWTVGGWVCSQPFDHTSVLQLLERFTGVREPNITDWRRQTFGDLTSAFRFGQRPARSPVLPGTADMLALALQSAANLPDPAIPGARQPLPAQEKGVRKRVKPS
ncbi:alkaline phosphatase family protein [Sphingomonas sp.]|uniref:alkaline phosphatase family protein n=1 Tax=Sphingomonas sp. TaxID=28214 RepID=UPI002C616026|nr:alkaline phosphatase family protein [Sphingomonas sp.]HWK34817.1 alkaline phosphatase family protein [Sphingomonas sp.]